MNPVRLAAVRIGGDPSAWGALGFTVTDGAIALANGAIELAPGSALVVEPDDPDVALPADVEGVPLVRGRAVPAAAHPNGAQDLDHVVLITDSLERTSDAVAHALGLPQRRVREAGEGDRRVRQAFHRFAPAADGTTGCIVEIVESARTQGATALFGLVVIVADLEALCAALGPGLIGLPKPAVQPGRLIATVRSSAGLGVPVALMSPDA